jgi:hypothetical protein
MRYLCLRLTTRCSLYNLALAPSIHFSFQDRFHLNPLKAHSNFQAEDLHNHFLLLQNLFSRKGADLDTSNLVYLNLMFY